MSGRAFKEEAYAIFSTDVLCVCSVIVVDDAGFADVRVEQLEQKKEVRLQPSAPVKGKLQIGSPAGTSETVRSLRIFPARINPRNFSALSLFLTTKTDENGNYDFDRVPPVAVQIYHEPKVRELRTGTIANSAINSLRGAARRNDKVGVPKLQRRVWHSCH